MAPRKDHPGYDRPAIPVRTFQAELDQPILSAEAMRAIEAIHEQISQKLFETRLRLRLRQHDVAGALGISNWQLSKYERGLNRIRADLLVRFACVYNISVLDLLPSEAAFTATPVSAELFALFAAIEDLPETKRAALTERLRSEIERSKTVEKAPLRRVYKKRKKAAGEPE